MPRGRAAQTRGTCLALQMPCSARDDNSKGAHARHSPSLQSFCLQCDPVRTDLSDRGRNRELALARDTAVSKTLAALVADLVGNDAAGRPARSPDDSIHVAAVDAGLGAP